MGQTAKTAAEIRSLLASEAFTTWYRQYVEVRRQLALAASQESDQALQARLAALTAEADQTRGDARVFEAGEQEDLAVEAQAEASAAESASYALLSRFERQRREGTLRWQDSDRLAGHADDMRQQLESLQARLQATRNVGSQPKSEADRLSARARELEASLVRSEAEASAAQARTQKVADEKDSLWSGVESAWGRAFAVSMVRSEHGLNSRRARAEAEAEYLKSGAQKRRADELQDRARTAAQSLIAMQQTMQGHRQKAEEAFGAVVLSDFMFWPQSANVQAAWMVPLIDETRHLNVPVQALGVYEVDRVKGLDSVALLSEGNDVAPMLPTETAVPDSVERGDAN